ncbi:MAG: signal peptidase I [Candidatus Staskawiczbacteria bacterium CG10_big_fil_rev_8_21_14_0_10_38_10]|uniref:Signal peptidase I n=1 Tax=Candidatus Staskawiczbacteria bacterium CG10_big_fil_rev_8_21_14_0_10_38_10 TaxID=1974891 RepID=A0A2H9T1X5_9BACT|nr:MAG: signal peptidase I [Candidatus Staskawiczbacteria bacterium CG10_big_fil_rev_8_21_14_0_10_38_10]
MIKKTLFFLFEISKIVIVAFLIVVPIRYFLFQPFVVRGSSMEPNFYSGDYLIIDEISYRFEKPERGEVIVFKYPQDPSQRFIKRIIGLPGETIEMNNGKITIIGSDGKTQALDESIYLPPQNSATERVVKLGSDEYFVMGDNRDFSSDSRAWGSLPQKNIIGKVFLRVFPFTAFAKIEAPAY